MSPDLDTPVAKTRHSCESSDSRHSNTSRASRDSLGQKTRNLVHGIRNRFSTDTLNAEHDDGTTSLPSSPAKHRWWKSLRSKGAAPHIPVMTIPWVGPAAATVRYGASPHRASEFADSLGKACRRERLPDRLPLMFTSNTPDDDGPSNDGTSALSGSGSLRTGKSSVGSPPKLEMPASMELGSDTLVSFREMSEQAIQDVGEKYDKGERTELHYITRDKEATLDGKRTPYQIRSIVTASIDEVLAAANTADAPVEASQSKVQGPGIEGSTMGREFPVHPRIDCHIYSKETESRETSSPLPEDTWAEGIVRLLSRQGLKTQFPTYGFWQRHGEVIEHHNGEEALIDFLQRNQSQLWSNQLLYHEPHSTLYALPPWVIVDRKKLDFKSWTWASLEVFPIGDEFLLNPAIVEADLYETKNAVVDTERDMSRFGKVHGRRTRDTIPTQERQGDSSASPVTHGQLDSRSGKHVSFAEKIQVLNEPDDGSLADNEDDGEVETDDDLTDSTDQDKECCSVSEAIDTVEALSEIKNASNAEGFGEHSILAHPQVIPPGPKLRRSTTSIQKLQVDALSRREDDLENMSPIELEDMDLDMAKTLDGRQ